MKQAIPTKRRIDPQMGRGHTQEATTYTCVGDVVISVVLRIGRDSCSMHGGNVFLRRDRLTAANAPLETFLWQHETVE